MSGTKADVLAAERVLKRAVEKAMTRLREGNRDVFLDNVRTFDVAISAAELLTEDAA